VGRLEKRNPIATLRYLRHFIISQSKNFHLIRQARLFIFFFFVKSTRQKPALTGRVRERIRAAHHELGKIFIFLNEEEEEEKRQLIMTQCCRHSFTFKKKTSREPKNR